jgi:RimJ/RimL family protein N-acetyltransferase
VNIRDIQSDDAEAFLALSNQLDEETSFMLYEPGERKDTVEQQRKKLEHIVVAENKTFLVAEEKDELIGFIACIGGDLKRNSKCANIVVGVLQEYSGKGVGTRLFDKVEGWAYEKGIYRLELTVMEHNRAAMMLYAKAGFKIEGTRKQALFIDGEYVNEFYMGKLLDT